MNQTSSKTWGMFVVALVIGLLGGYFYGSSAGVKKGIAREKAASEARIKAAEKEAAKAANPFEQAKVNPFGASPVNPFDQVKVNPFE